MRIDLFQGARPKQELARIFAQAILRLHRRSALFSEVSADLLPDCLDVSPKTSVTVVPAGLQTSSQQKGTPR